MPLILSDFIRGLLEHVGAEIDPIRLIRRINDGLEIPGLKAAIIKILQASNLHVSISKHGWCCAQTGAQCLGVIAGGLSAHPQRRL